MKKILIVLTSVVIILSLTGCGNKVDNQTKEEIKIGEESNLNITDKDVSLKIKEGTLTNSGATLILENDSDITISFGEGFGLEIEQNDKWYALETIHDYVINLPLYNLKPKELKEMAFSWGYVFGKLPKGKYRVTKSITLEFENDNKEKTYITCDFNID